MRMRFALLVLMLWWTLPCGRSAGPVPVSTWTFGLSLATGPHSELYSLFLVQEFQYKVVQVEGITREQFVLQAQGAIPSKANPDGGNLFIAYKVKECVRPGDPSVPVRDCGVFDRLWKLRFWEYPFHVPNGKHPGRGWSEKPSSPSERQRLLLSDYGLERFTDLAYGENCFRLLRDLGDTSWVDNYRQGY